MRSIGKLLLLLLKLCILILLGLVFIILNTVAGVFRHWATVNIQKYEKKPTKLRGLQSRLCYAILGIFGFILTPLLHLMSKITPTQCKE